MDATSMQNSSDTPKELSRKALESNKSLQGLLTKHAERLEAELKEVDRLLGAADTDEWDDELDIEVQIPGAKRPVGVIPAYELLNPESPFFEEASQRMEYVNNTTVHTSESLRYFFLSINNTFLAVKDKELKALADAVKRENQRLQAYNTQLSAQRHANPITIDLENNTEGLDWNVIAERVSDSSTTPCTADECRIRWLGDKHPKINHGEWTSNETENLKSLVSDQLESAGKVDWVDVVKKLGTNRTPIDCMRKGLPRQRHTWTPESDNKLAEAVERFGIDNWPVVATYVSEHVTATQCQGRYNNTINPAIKKGLWTGEEDARLRKAVASYGNSWIDVAAMMPGRTNDQCRERWTDHLSIGTKSGWTDDEDKVLWDLVASMGHKWKAISERIGGGKTGSTCRFRYDRLKRLREAGEVGAAGLSTAATIGIPSEGTTTPAQLSTPVPNPLPSKPRPKPRTIVKGKAKGTVVEPSADVASTTSQHSPITVDESAQIKSVATIADSAARRRPAPTEPVTPPAESTSVTPAVLPKPKPKPKPRPVKKGKANANEAGQAQEGAGTSVGDSRSSIDVQEPVVLADGNTVLVPPKPLAAGRKRKASQAEADVERTPAKKHRTGRKAKGDDAPPADVDMDTGAQLGTLHSQEDEDATGEELFGTSNTAHDTTQSATIPVPSKRGRGRPRKSAAVEPAPSKEMPPPPPPPPKLKQSPKKASPSKAKAQVEPTDSSRRRSARFAVKYTAEQADSGGDGNEEPSPSAAAAAATAATTTTAEDEMPAGMEASTSVE
ncbi:hypothetical protein BDQ12DRAFT_661894 [Crucibulum laeve]|uniref:Homeodomain-like protein n=1 Tax=Crucibulum laeve TaxID=68775 RepID=A0A5C3MEX7_9AGAR|nr:hypothetical protein BDQ12DRAFT_661894 [Crucibulum laeve]